MARLNSGFIKCTKMAGWAVFFLVTGDKDLLVLKTVSGVVILNPREFEGLVASI